MRVQIGRFETGCEVHGRGAPVVMVHRLGGGASPFQYPLNAPAVAAVGCRSYVPGLLSRASCRPAAAVR